MVNVIFYKGSAIILILTEDYSMKLFYYICLIAVLYPSIATAQKISVADLYMRGELTTHGFFPRDLASLVGSSAIIFKGQFHKYVGTEQFYGFNNTREEFGRRLNLSEEELDHFAVPLSTYEIVVDEVLLGENIHEDLTIIFRLNEPLEVENFYISDEERLFFLAPNPDGSYAAIGNASIQIARDGKYVYDSLAPNLESFQGKVLDIVDSVKIADFEKLVKEEIGKL